MKILFLISVLSLINIISPLNVCADAVKTTTVVKRNPAFVTPKDLQPRVNFWINIFTKYGEHHEVIHHRAYPQAVFKVLNFYSASQKMSDIALEKFKKKEIKKHVQLVKIAVQKLATGAVAKTELEKIVEKQMSFLGVGTQKYKDLLEDDMIRSQQGIKERYREAVENSGLYMVHIEKIFKDEKLPIELTRLPFVESSFQYKARSSVGAVGIWQFMPKTARTYGLTVNNILDERLDVIESSHAAAKYLAHAYKVLESWPLAVTSYNHGIVGVARKVKTLGTRDISQVVEHRTQRLLGFASNNFYPELLAAITVYENIQQYFPNIIIHQPIQFTEYQLKSPTSVGYISNQLHTSMHELMPLNYALLSPVWSGRYRIPSGYKLKIPVPSSKYKDNLAKTEPMPSVVSSVYPGLTYRVRKGDTLISLARKYNVTVKYLKTVNDLKNTNIKVGQTLIVKGNGYKNNPQKETLNQKINTREDIIPQTTTSSYTVKKGDTLYKIASNNKMSVDSLKKLNNLKSNSIKIGQRLKIYSATNAVQQTKHVQAKTNTNYIVRSGDSLWSIAKKHGKTVDAIKKKNNLKSNNLKLGMKLVIP